MGVTECGGCVNVICPVNDVSEVILFKFVILLLFIFKSVDAVFPSVITSPKV